METTTVNRRTVPMATEIHATLEKPDDDGMWSKREVVNLVSHY